MDHPTLRFVALMPAGSRVVFDYMISPALLNPAERIFFDRLARRAALAGGPRPSSILLPQPYSADHGVRTGQDIEPQEMDARYSGDERTS